MAQKNWTLISTERYPIQIVKKDNTVRSVVEIPKRFPTNFEPFTITKKEIRAKLNESDICFVEPSETNAQREVTQKQIEIISQKFPGSRFVINVPFHFLTRESKYHFITLNMVNGVVNMNFFDRELICDEMIDDKNGLKLTEKQLMKRQEIMSDNRKKKKPSEEEIYLMFDEDGNYRQTEE